MPRFDGGIKGDPLRETQVVQLLPATQYPTVTRTVQTPTMHIPSRHLCYCYNICEIYVLRNSAVAVLCTLSLTRVSVNGACQPLWTEHLTPSTFQTLKW
jgi:hypothetical protein